MAGMKPPRKRGRMWTPRYAIQYDEPQSYYVGMGGIGPIFGGTEATAKIFDTAADAATEMMKHWTFSCAGITEAKWLRK